jgi:hypothetical protein
MLNLWRSCFYDMIYTVPALVPHTILPKRYVKRGASAKYCGNNIWRQPLRRVAPNSCQISYEHLDKIVKILIFHQNFLGHADDAYKFSDRYLGRNFLRNDCSGLNPRNSVTKLFLGLSDDACNFPDPYLWNASEGGRLLGVPLKNFKEDFSVTLISICGQHFMSISLLLWLADESKYDYRMKNIPLWRSTETLGPIRYIHLRFDRTSVPKQ